MVKRRKRVPNAAFLTSGSVSLGYWPRPFFNKDSSFYPTSDPVVPHLS